MSGSQRQSRFEQRRRCGGNEVRRYVGGGCSGDPAADRHRARAGWAHSLCRGERAGEGHRPIAGGGTCGRQGIWGRHWRRSGIFTFATKSLRIRSWSGPAYGSLDRELRGEFQALESLLQELESSRHLDLKAQDRLWVRGMLLQQAGEMRLFAEAGLQAAHVDARNALSPTRATGRRVRIWDVTE